MPRNHTTTIGGTTLHHMTHNDGEVKELAWKCHKCSRHNHLHTLKCVLGCGSWKGRSQRSTRTSTEGCELVWGVDRHGDECAVCGDGGELICCDKCDKVYHGNCLHVDDPNTLPDPWHCPACCDPDFVENKKMPPVKREQEQNNGDNSQNESENEIDTTPLSRLSPRKKRKHGNNSDECYICDIGGMLVCCDHCDKSFHENCHVPPLLSIPEGNWKCCECSASSFNRRFRCGVCEACLREDCGVCVHCLDKPKFGGQCLLKQVCIHKVCPFKRYAPPATVTPAMKREILQMKKDGITDEPTALFSSAAEMLGNRSNADNNRKHRAVMGKEEGPRANNESTSARRSKRSFTPSLKVKDVAKDYVAAKAVAAAPYKRKEPELPKNVSCAKVAKPAGQKMGHHNTANNEGSARGSKPAASVEVAAEDDMDDTFSLVTLPLPRANSGTDDYDDDADDDTGGDDDDDEIPSCKCRKSKCLKKYCECYSNRTKCGVSCRCENCGNQPDVAAAAPVMPSQQQHDGGGGVSPCSDGNTPRDLVLCQQELKRAQAENKRQADEIKRLKSAVQALTASLTG